MIINYNIIHRWNVKRINWSSAHGVLKGPLHFILWIEANYMWDFHLSDIKQKVKEGTLAALSMLRGFLNAIEPLEETNSQVLNYFLLLYTWYVYRDLASLACVCYRSALLWQCVKQLQRQRDEERSAYS